MGTATQTMRRAFKHQRGRRGYAVALEGWEAGGNDSDRVLYDKLYSLSDKEAEGVAREIEAVMAKYADRRFGEERHKGDYLPVQPT
jgi:hypothetical protein